MGIEGAVAFVTGGSGGLGTAIAVALAEAGCHVAVGYRNGRERAARAAEAVTARGRRAALIQLDQGDPASIEAAVAAVVNDLGGLDILVNNAAGGPLLVGCAAGGKIIPEGDLDAFTPEIWDEMMAVNVRGPYLLARAAAAHLRRSKWGRIVNLGSTIGHGTWGAAAGYAPAKAMAAPLTRFLAAALAPDVTVNCVAPGLMEGTEMSGGAPEDYVNGWKARAVSGQTTSIADVAGHVVAFCRSGTTTGQVLVVDGGIHFR